MPLSMCRRLAGCSGQRTSCRERRGHGQLRAGAGFRRYWRWKSRNLGGRPPIDAGVRALIRRMSLDNVVLAQISTRLRSTGDFRAIMTARRSP